MERHRTAERRSLAYHREIARRLVEDPSIVSGARVLVRDRIERATHGAREWQEILDSPLEEIIAAITSDDERMTNLRQMTPFLGILDPRTRWALWRSTR